MKRGRGGEIKRGRGREWKLKGEREGDVRSCNVSTKIIQTTSVSLDSKCTYLHTAFETLDVDTFECVCIAV